MVPIQFEDTTLEVMARIVKAASHKYNCDVEIDFSNGARKVVFKGGEEMKAYIAGEVIDIFESKEGDVFKWRLDKFTHLCLDKIRHFIHSGRMLISKSVGSYPARE